ncbi:hypothetical protein ACPCSP_25710 [Streptomyces cinereoruber]
MSSSEELRKAAEAYRAGAAQHDLRAVAAGDAKTKANAKAAAKARRS